MQLLQFCLCIEVVLCHPVANFSLSRLDLGQAIDANAVATIPQKVNFSLYRMP
jgi:hypothetical protein